MTNESRIMLLALLVVLAGPFILASQLPAPLPCGSSTACYLCDGYGEGCYCIEAPRLLTNAILNAVSTVSYWDCEDVS